jgi:hypothetical protein
MRFAVEAWAAEYGSAIEEAAVLATPEIPADLTVEVPVTDWAPRSPPVTAEPAEVVLFTDGVRRIDARVWIDDGEAGTRLGVCASFGAGVVRTVATTADAGTTGLAGNTAYSNQGDNRARLVAAEIRRGLFTAAATAEPITSRHATFEVRAAVADGPESLALAVQQRMGELEVELAAQAGPGDLIVVDGPLRGRQHVPHAIGYVKTHHVAYLPPVVEGVVAALGPGQRTPLFLTSTSWTRYSWYLRLPGGVGHAWAGVVRGEASADLDPAAAARLADVATVTLPRFASAAHKDPRAPQNLYPIAGLERVLRHRLGDPSLLYRSLVSAAERGRLRESASHASEKVGDVH